MKNESTECRSCSSRDFSEGQQVNPNIRRGWILSWEVEFVVLSLCVDEFEEVFFWEYESFNFSRWGNFIVRLESVKSLVVCIFKTLQQQEEWKSERNDISSWGIQKKMQLLEICVWCDDVFKRCCSEISTDCKRCQIRYWMCL
jgi:hypothetical protein